MAGGERLNKNELQAEMKRNSYTYRAMAQALEISENGLWRKMNGLTDFTLTEIQEIIRVLGLDDPQIKKIFFD